MKIRCTQALGQTLACILSSPEGLTVAEILALRQCRSLKSTYTAVHKMRDAGLIRVTGRGRQQSPRYSITPKGIECWGEMIKWAEKADRKRGTARVVM